MSQLSRRSALLAAPVAASLVTAGAATAAAGPQPGLEVVSFVARRRRFTLPNLPPLGIALGTTFVGTLDLVDEAGKKLGDGSAAPAGSGPSAAAEPSSTSTTPTPRSCST